MDSYRLDCGLLHDNVLEVHMYQDMDLYTSDWYMLDSEDTQNSQHILAYMLVDFHCTLSGMSTQLVHLFHGTDCLVHKVMDCMVE